MSVVAKVSGETFSAEAVHDEETAIHIVFNGTADFEAKTDLETVIKKLHTEAQALEVERVVVDFRELEFMNSSCFKVFVSWLAQVQEMPADQQYRIHFRSNPNLHWQRRSLAALSCFAVDLVAIET